MGDADQALEDFCLVLNTLSRHDFSVCPLMDLPETKTHKIRCSGYKDKHCTSLKRRARAVKVGASLALPDLVQAPWKNSEAYPGMKRLRKPMLLFVDMYYP